MGSGLAGAIMGQQTALEQEKMGLENLYKGMEMPGNILKAEEQTRLLNDPKYLEQKTANTLIELGNQYDTNQIQQSLNTIGRFKIQLDAAKGDPAKTQQLVEQGIAALKLDPTAADYARREPYKFVDQMISGHEAVLARTGGAKYAGDMAKQELVGQQQMDVAKLQRESAERVAGIGANAQYAGMKYTADKNNEAQLAVLANQERQRITALDEEIRKLTPSVVDQSVARKLNKELTAEEKQAQSRLESLKQERADAVILRDWYLGKSKHAPETPPPVKGGERRSLDSFDPSAQPQKPAPAPVAAPVQPVPVAATPQATPTPAPVPTQQPTQAPQPTAVEQASQVPTQRVFGGQQQINPVMLGESSSGYLPRGGQQTLHDRTAQRKQAQVDMLKRQFAEATLEVSKWESRTNYPYGRTKLAEAQQALEEARTKLSALQ
jgi:hypothetical protein